MARLDWMGWAIVMLAVAVGLFTLFATIAEEDPKCEDKVDSAVGS